MKRRLYFCPVAVAMGLFIALVMAVPPTATAAGQTATETAIRSVFVIPSNPQEGRDPFFPASTRPYQRAQTVAHPHVADITSLVLKGISGPPDHRLAIINSHTFAVGDEQDLVTSQGRLRVHCVEIKSDTVVVEFAGESHELKYVPNR
jgi:hypothetical protein